MDPSEETKLKADFERDGFVIIRDFFSRDQVDEICRRAEAALGKTKANTTGMFTNVTKGLERFDEYFDDLLRNGPQVSVLGMLLGRDPEPTTASFFTKSKHSEEVHPHSDAMSGGVVWVAIDPATAANGCLHFLKGSHLKEAEFAHLSASKATDLTNHPDVVVAAMNPGDIAFFRPTTVHWSGPNLEGSVRRGFNCFYVGDFSKGWKNLSKEELLEIKSQKQAGTTTA
ncbi:MAG: phytanoyl-CoA dioxygenase family protein [Proteobacteria bacterium]|jgi:phytanoyl-CoA hydroxylase|nr:phytanoyl-CoA dioxygenase family protein [Pseudomonadota bacterium]MDA1299475.1 phytanoyl-CoA dioxygenase family protein [Pseudomonadota bacterium]